MSVEWLSVFEALYSVYSEGAYSNIAVNDVLSKREGLASNFVRAFVKGVVRDSIKLDWYISQLAKNGIKGIKIRTLIVLRMGLFAIEELDSVPDYAAVNESVALAKKVSKGSYGFVNALLRSFIRRRDELVIEDNNLSIRYSFPQTLVDLFQEQYGDEAIEIIKALSNPSALVIRTNSLKTDSDSLISKLEEAGVKCRKCTESNRALICEGGNVLATEEYSQGLFSVQSLSSIIAVEAFHPTPGSRVLDMCAAPGGKSCAIAEMMDNKGEIISCDIHEHRLGLIEASCSRLGVNIVKTRRLDGAKTVKELEDSFDYVLADVPCSGLGVIASKPEIKYSTDVKKYSELIEIQKKILQNALKYAKPGGLIEYSSCTLNRNENENLVKNVLKEFRLVQILEINTFMPYNDKVGFFYCIMKKNPSK